MKVMLGMVAALMFAFVANAEVTSGPKAGDKAEEFKAFGTVGLIEGKEANYLKERKDEPTVYVFVQHEFWGRPMARFLKVLDKDAKEANDKSAIVAVWLSEKPEPLKEHLPKVQGSLMLVNTSLGVFEGEKSGPNGWAINADANATVVVVKGGKVVESITLTSVNETDVKKVVEVLKKMK